MPRHHKSSKSKLLSFLQCPKRLWLQTHRPELAQDAYLEMIHPDTAPERREKLRQALLDYCAMDTYALVQLVKFFAKTP